MVTLCGILFIFLTTGVLGSVLTICRALIPEEHIVFNPKKDMEEIEAYTHYVPKHWQGREHTLQVEGCKTYPTNK